MQNITSANAVIVLTCEDLYAAGIQLQQFSADQSISQNDDTIGASRMGVDGHMSVGYTPSIKEVTISFEPSSPSVEVFDNIYKENVRRMNALELGLTVYDPATGKTITYSGGALISWKILPDHKQVLDPISAVMHFEKVS